MKELSPAAGRFPPWPLSMGVAPPAATRSVCSESGLMALSRRPPRPALPDEPLVDPGRSLGLRLLALLGAVSFVMLGLSSIAPLLQPPAAPPLPDQRRLPMA